MSTSYIDVDVHQALMEAGPEFNEGSLEVAYSGHPQQLGAQVKMVDEAQPYLGINIFDPPTRTGVEKNLGYGIQTVLFSNV